MAFIENMGIFSVTPELLLMWLIGLTLIYLAVTRQYEPLLLLPIGLEFSLPTCR